MTPIGIWRSVKATVNAVTAPTPSVVAIEVTTTNVIWVAPRPMARGTIRPERLAGRRVRRVDGRRVAEPEPAPSAGAGRARGRSRPATTPIATPWMPIVG